MGMSMICPLRPAYGGDTSPKFHELGIWGRTGRGWNDEMMKSLSEVVGRIKENI